MFSINLRLLVNDCHIQLMRAVSILCFNILVIFYSHIRSLIRHLPIFCYLLLIVNSYRWNQYPIRHMYVRDICYTYIITLNVVGIYVYTEFINLKCNHHLVHKWCIWCIEIIDTVRGSATACSCWTQNLKVYNLY